jgi:hypothetical protein
MKVDQGDLSIIFGSSIFDRTLWTVCDNYLGVKLSTIFFELADKNKTLEDELKIMSEEKQSLVLILLTAFNRASIDDTDGHPPTHVPWYVCGG